LLEADNISGFIHSWLEHEHCLHTIDEILAWVQENESTTVVNITRTTLDGDAFWFYDKKKGEITNKNNSFFSITGFIFKQREQLLYEQPIIIQDEIGFLGIICKNFSGILHFLMQAKIEPGNINKIQISPTIQATKSNFLRKHSGKEPAYLEYFLNSSCNKLIVDQIQSEQSSRFYKKRNRNIIILVDEEVTLLPNFCWMTLWQIKHLMRHDNLVNMDTRTVLSCIPFCRVNILNTPNLHLFQKAFSSNEFFNSVFSNDGLNSLPAVYQEINNHKMFNDSYKGFIPLHKLRHWNWHNGQFICEYKANFKISFFDIEINSREVSHWTQPLFEATGISTFGLPVCQQNGIMLFLVCVKPEVGCFDILELGPAIQLEPTEEPNPENPVERLFFEYFYSGKGIIHNVLLSEEGGRFYCEQNRNLIVEIPSDRLKCLPAGYFWLDFRTLNYLIQINNCLNIQLRNLLSLLEA